MNEPAAKNNPPAYVSTGAFISFINRLRDTSVPARIDRSLMGSASGSLVSSLFAALRSLNLVDDDKRPTELMRRLVTASDEERKPIYKELFERGYANVLEDQDFHLETATTAQLATRFREQGMSGSTVTKAVAFFLSLAKLADIKVSPHLKAPAVQRANGGKKTGKGAKRDSDASSADVRDEGGEEEEGAEEDVERFEVPIPGKASVRVIVPRDLDADDWEMLQSMITVYIKRWKGFKSGGSL